MKALTINKYDDSGHDWAKVSKKLLTRLGIADKISGYSYERGDYAYLEEDCDFDVLMTELENNNISIKMIYHSTNKQSKIRGYERYSK